MPRPEAMASQTRGNQSTLVRQGACDIFEEKQDQEDWSTMSEGKNERLEKGDKGKRQII